MRLLTATVAVAITCGSCASASLLTRYECDQPDQLLRMWLERFEAERGRGCTSSGRLGSTSCPDLQREIEHLSIICSGHAPILLANAIVAYELNQSFKAQQFLDQIFERPVANADAAALRARIALEEGNLPFARRLLEQQIKLTPDHAGLREAYGATLYLGGRLDDARRELRAAKAFGAPDWRVEYHLGLVEESAGNLSAALAHYMAAVASNPESKPAQSRLNALRQGARPGS